MAGAAYTVFMSHAGDDLAIARLLAKVVKEAGAECVLDATHIQGGDRILSWIRDTIESSQELLILLSRNALDSEYVRLELGLALGRDLRITPMLHDLGPDECRVSPIISQVLATTSYIYLNDFESYQLQLKARIAEAAKLAEQQALAESITDVIRKKKRTK